MANRLNIAARLLFCVSFMLFMPESPRSRDHRSDPAEQKGMSPDRVLVLDGSFVHDVGELQMHMSNWGIFGSMPTATFPFSFAPSAQWPAGSGVEYLYVAGVWIGARCGGIPSVSTSAFQMEFRPTDDPIDVIFRTYEGASGGNRYPFPGADDDGDGLFDEDRLDGRDNDGDGRIDEDFGAISNQMFTSWYTDDQPASTQIYPEHRPLHVKVEQESYQWSAPLFEDFVGVTLKITNVGTEILEDVHLGLFPDIDAGPRGTPGYWEDDAQGAFFGVRTTELGLAYLNVMYGYDADGDAGATPGYFGCMLLGHTLDPLGIDAPESAVAFNYRVFRGNQPYENGGDPVNDFQRYELMSKHQFDMASAVPGDYHVLMCTGCFEHLGPGESIELHLGFVAGLGLEGMLENAARAQRLFDGTWYDVDRDPATGVDGKETQVHWVLDRPLEIEAAMDIRPRSCPNPLSMHGIFGPDVSCGPGHKPKPKPEKGGNLPVAVLGSESFDVRDIDRETVLLEGVAPLGKKQPCRDVSRPAADTAVCACTTEGPDGYLDLLLKFGSRDIARALHEDAPLVRGETRVLTLTGSLLDGTQFFAKDCVVIVGRSDRRPDDGPDDGPDHEPDGKPDDPRGEPELGAAVPNPFNPVTRIPYYLPERSRVRVSVFDASGRMVAVLAEGIRDAGEHYALWEAHGCASGIYFCRLEAGAYTATRKIVLIK